MYKVTEMYKNLNSVQLHVRSVLSNKT